MALFAAKIMRATVAKAMAFHPVVASGFEHNARFQHRPPAFGAASYMRHYKTSDRQLVAAKYASHEPRPELLRERAEDVIRAAAVVWTPDK